MSALSFINASNNTKSIVSKVFFIFGLVIIIGSFTVLPNLINNAELKKETQVNVEQVDEAPNTVIEEQIYINTSEPTITPTESLINDSNFEQLKIGTGIFISANTSDGLRDYDISSYYKVQRIRYEEFPDGCSVSDWRSQLLWVTGNKGTDIFLNNELIGTLEINTGNHGYLIQLLIKPGDKLCISGKNANGFSLLFGPDVFYHYDSYCFRGFCN